MMASFWLAGPGPKYLELYFWAGSAFSQVHVHMCMIAVVVSDLLGVGLDQEVLKQEQS